MFECDLSPNSVNIVELCILFQRRFILSMPKQEQSRDFSVMFLYLNFFTSLIGVLKFSIKHIIQSASVGKIPYDS